MPFGPYLLLKRLAVGGMAELFLAKDTRNERMVVLKRILPYLAEEAEFVRMFLDEARIAASLHHGSVIEVYELGLLEGSTFIAMEWVDGMDLRKVLQKEQERGGVVPPGIAAWLVARLCEGLHYAHFRNGPDGKPLGIIHRDVSPQNVMVSFKGDVKLVDFGIAKATAWMSRSKPGVIKGKFLYLAPEQLTQDRLDHRADLFALGTMLYELTTGKSPFYRASTEAVIYAIRMEEAQAPHTLRPGYPQSLSRIVMKCLQKDRAKRYQSAEEITAALDDFLRVDAPTTKADVVRYIASLFGDDEERTSIFIPPNAQSKEAVPVEAVKTDPTTQQNKGSPFANIHEEHTAPIVPKGRPVPEGRRQTGTVELSGETSDPGKGEQTSVTAPMPRPRDTATTAVLDEPVPTKSTKYERAGAAEFDPTAVSMSGARDVPVGGMMKDLVPTRLAQSLSGAPSVPSMEAIEPSGISRPGPPLPDDDIPEVSMSSVVSVGDATIGATNDNLPPVPEKRRPPTVERARPEPIERKGTTPRAQTSAQKKLIRKPRLGDADDLIDTVDMGGLQGGFSEISLNTPEAMRRKVMIGLGAVAGLAVLIVLIALLWPSSEPAPPKKATPAKVAPPAEGKVRVQIRAPKGTEISIDGATIAPGESLERAVGKMVVVYTCPPKKKAKQPEQTLDVAVAESSDVLAVDLSCK